MDIRYIGGVTERLSLAKVVDSENVNQEKKFDLSFKAVFPDINSQTFYIYFNCHLIDPNSFSIDIDYNCEFETSELIDDLFKNSPFPLINAPAIAFPFLRSLLATVSLNCGFKPILLPSINFVKLQNEKRIDYTETHQ